MWGDNEFTHQVASKKMLCGSGVGLGWRTKSQGFIRGPGAPGGYEGMSSVVG